MFVLFAFSIHFLCYKNANKIRNVSFVYDVEASVPRETFLRQGKAINRCTRSENGLPTHFIFNLIVSLKQAHPLTCGDAKSYDKL